MLLSKGFEVEMYTGTPNGDIVGLSDRIVADLDRFSREPDSRNVEYTTAPFCDYDILLCDLVRPRQQLRHYLKTLGDYTLIPGSTLSLGDSRRFFRSDPGNPYHDYIEQSYGSKVVTASVHINVGISDPEALMRAARLIRVEAPLYLALSASSPFLDVRAADSRRSTPLSGPECVVSIPRRGTHWLRLHSLVCLSPGSANGSPIWNSLATTPLAGLSFPRFRKRFPYLKVIVTLSIGLKSS